MTSSVARSDEGRGDYKTFHIMAMCKIYYFVQSMTYTASVLLLTAVAVERYIAIIYPIRSRRLVTQSRLIVSQIIIWVISAAYHSPELTMFNLVGMKKGNTTLLFCFCDKPYTNMRNYYTINFCLWYILPLSDIRLLQKVINESMKVQQIHICSVNAIIVLISSDPGDEVKHIVISVATQLRTILRELSDAAF
ncbi:hypothetical protein RRG08_059128 [Elysia crispata]|uniref:G-protein coupled receptors family 1 profile domain-containing protein n=1 Tax=Elysia crispata TaxID=231223 RepID=A0AAE0XXA8_9GAST|nr:hypothetical protein RRG08_059128 [Elysia crispata]